MIVNCFHSRNVFGYDLERLSLPFVQNGAPQVHHTLLNDCIDESDRSPLMVCHYFIQLRTNADIILAASSASCIRLTTARIKLERVTMPTSLLPRSTGSRLMRWRSISRTISSSGVSSITVCN